MEGRDDNTLLHSVPGLLASSSCFVSSLRRRVSSSNRNVLHRGPQASARDAQFFAAASPQQRAMSEFESGHYVYAHAKSGHCSGTPPRDEQLLRLCILRSVALDRKLSSGCSTYFVGRAAGGQTRPAAGFASYRAARVSYKDVRGPPLTAIRTQNW